VTDLATETPEVSTVLDAEPLGGASGAGAPTKLPAEEPSLRDTIADAMKGEAKEEKPADAAKPDPKPDDETDKKAPEKGAEKPEGEAKPAEAKEAAKAPERGADGKFQARDKPAESDAPQPDTAKPEAKADEKPGGHIEPPAKFLPDAKETWRNTPRAVQRDVANMAQQYEAEVSRYREAAERYEPIRQFDEIVRQNGRAGVHETLAEVAQLEDLMGKNPLAALNQILLRAGPRKADGSPVSLFEVAQTIVQMGQQGYNQAVSRVPQAQPAQNDNAQTRQLEQRLAEMQAQMLTATVIEPFKRDHPRYDELQDDIALFLQSGRIPDSLSPQERLEAAYDMAVRINPASHVPDAAKPKADPDPGDRAVDDDLSGSKSIKSTPGAVSPDLEPDRGGSIREILRDQMRRTRVS
jgi:hypothetical protein